MLPIIVAAVLAAFFHVVPMPDDVAMVPSFELQGFSQSGVTHELSAYPQFNAETEQTRPYARVSFIAPMDGTCAVAQTRTIAGDTTFALRQIDTYKKGERTYMFVPLPDDAERKASDEPGPLSFGRDLRRLDAYDHLIGDRVRSADSWLNFSCFV